MNRSTVRVRFPALLISSLREYSRPRPVRDLWSGGYGSIPNPSATMALIQLHDASLTFGIRPLLENVQLVIGEGERIGLLGRNGEGKSTLMRVLQGTQNLDEGTIFRKPGLRISMLGQEVETGEYRTVFEVVLSGLGQQGELIREYHRLAHEAGSGDETALAKLASVQQAIDAADAWSIETQATVVITRMNLDPDAEYQTLSGGMKRRVLLARALVNDPEILLLDEPTNHLDLDAIAWLEDFLSKFQGTLIFVTHDRRFLENLSTRILELDRGRLFDWSCGYKIFLERKQELLDAEELANARFDKKLAQEEIWIRKGIKARRTRNEGRVAALKKMREERQQRLSPVGNATIRIQQGSGSGTLICEAVQASAGYEGKTIIRDVNSIIHRGDRVGIIGPNGSGKTTLIKLILGQLPPLSGKVKTGTNLEIAYFDQHRSQLDPDKTVADNVSGGRDTITINGTNKHILSYLQDFLFSPERARSPVSVLSGGEKNRLLLAKLFTRPSNMLILDEPTNDLDIETLELLEEVLSEYKGTLLLVSHDRTFINNTTTQCLVVGSDGSVHEFIGDYDDWLRHQQATALPEVRTPKTQKEERTKSKPVSRFRHKEQKELDALPEKLESLESKHAELVNKMSDPSFYKQDQAIIREQQHLLETLETEIAAVYTRWEELELLREENESNS